MLRCCVVAFGGGKEKGGELESSEKVVYLQAERMNADETIFVPHRNTVTP